VSYTDADGFIDHVFAVYHLLSFRFALRIRNLPVSQVYTIEPPRNYPTIVPLVGGAVNFRSHT
jgi:TnpA family transposase